MQHTRTYLKCRLKHTFLKIHKHVITYTQTHCLKCIFLCQCYYYFPNSYFFFLHIIIVIIIIIPTVLPITTTITIWIINTFLFLYVPASCPVPYIVQQSGYLVQPSLSNDIFVYKRRKVCSYKLIFTRVQWRYSIVYHSTNGTDFFNSVTTGSSLFITLPTVPLCLHFFQWHCSVY